MTHASVPNSVADPPEGYPAEWEEDAVLRDGRSIRMRPIVPSDAEALQDFVGSLSTESAYKRFFSVKRELSPVELEAFTVLDYRDRMAFVAIHDGDIVAVGRYRALEDDPSIAEVAFTVADGYQGNGIGTHLLFRLTAYARTASITGFRAHLFADNHAMMRVFRNAGFQLAREIESGVYTVDFPTTESAAVAQAEGEAERHATAASVIPFFYPQSIAVIGASRDAASIGGRLMNNLINGDYHGPVYPVNPRTAYVRSIPTHASVLDIAAPIDLAFVVVPAPIVIDVVKECATKGVKAVCIISAGFSETGNTEDEAELLRIVREAGMRMVGPNCMGLLNTDPAVNLDGQFGPIVPAHGNVAMSSQSGALGLAILDYANQLGIGISTFVSIGNKADVSANDLLLFWEDDPNTDVILLYVESFGNPRRFARIARRIGKRKPIIAVKSGRTAAGARAASSHTGSLASFDVAVDALFDQAGVIRVGTLEELFDVTALLANQKPPDGNRVGIVTNAGGPAILAVDALESIGLEVPTFSDDLQARLTEFLSADAAVSNPVDMIAAAGPEEYQKALSVLLSCDEVDSVIALYIPASNEGSPEVASAIRSAFEEGDREKTFLAVYMNSAGAPPELTGRDERFPVFAFPERAARALAKAVAYTEWLDSPEGEMVHFPDVDRAGAKDRVATALAGSDDTDGTWLEPSDVDAILDAYGLSVPRSTTVTSADDAVSFARDIGGSVVLKVVSPTALHKSDVGGIALDVRGDDAVRAAYTKVFNAVDDAEGVLVQEFVADGNEVLIGMVEDPNFGPLIVFGLGGVFVELIGDVAFRIHPLTDVAAKSMVSEVKAAKLLEGYRGAAPGDIDAVIETLLRVSAMVEDVPEIIEMDLNPVKVGIPGEGVRIVDARIKVRSVAGSWIPARTDLPSKL